MCISLRNLLQSQEGFIGNGWADDAVFSDSTASCPKGPHLAALAFDECKVG